MNASLSLGILGSKKYLSINSSQVGKCVYVCACVCVCVCVSRILIFMKELRSVYHPAVDRAVSHPMRIVPFPALRSHKSMV